MRTCWKCGGPITLHDPDDGMMYTSYPPQYAHERCRKPLVVSPKLERMIERWEATTGFVPPKKKG